MIDNIIITNYLSLRLFSLICVYGMQTIALYDNEAKIKSSNRVLT